jgi:predicted TIM-barrel fold metal-dependent hydrolase
VATILTHSLTEALEESKRVYRGGVRAVVLPAGAPIEGRAPAHPDNDVLWKFYSDNNIPVLLHVGGEKAFLRDPSAWGNAPQFAPNNTTPSELNVDPFSMATCSLAGQTYVTNLVLGAVFERVPNLRLGLMELGGYWIGPTAENMDTWAELFASRFRNVLSMKPSEYVKRNIRVSPFTFEPVDKYIDRFPYLEDVYCFSTDYPHFEGGKGPLEAMAARVHRLGASATEKSFVKNAAWVMPS